LVRTTNALFQLSESRGKESAGLAVLTDKTIYVFKQPMSASTMIRSKEYHELFDRITENGSWNGNGSRQPAIALIGHSRLVTNGTQEIHGNNQPVIKDGLVGIHNGIVVNVEDLWREFPHLNRRYEVDTEIVLSLIQGYRTQTGSLVRGIQAAFEMIEGTASIATLFNDNQVLALATNNGSLYECLSLDGSVYIFASEEYILGRLFRLQRLRPMFDKEAILQIKSGTGCLIHIADVAREEYSLSQGDVAEKAELPRGGPYAILDVTPEESRAPIEDVGFDAPVVIPESIIRRYSVDMEPILSLHRCTNCVLTETMPFIEFDEEGVCNYCRGYQKRQLLGESALMKFADRYRSKDGKPDCIVTFSGGRDSSYGLHYVTTVLGMTPIAYSYDWGMITDLARRNQARLCGKLGIEHILISADISKKREYIRKNVTAWLKRPHLGTIPLFMAGDKQYFYYANRLRRQLGVDLIVLAANPMERTHFKTGYCGVAPSFSHSPSALGRAKLAAFYGKEYLMNPAYLNGSLLDTLGAFASYYLIKHNYLRPYDYIRWDEHKITSTLIREYDWEAAGDTETTWRIGDGTASFYNYIYYVVGGFTENDTFRSNQIREGVLSREEALALVHDENQPRFESLQWYCDTIGVDLESTLKRINSIPRLYETENH
jgi:hypothetical protein